jgi:chitin elicitor receptor kinase 1
VDKSPEFSYEELANATDNFSLANKIGQGGFGEVYYGALRGQVCNCNHHMVSFKVLICIDHLKQNFKSEDGMYHISNIPKIAIKKMKMQETREFLSELKVLTNVHHRNLVNFQT